MADEAWECIVVGAGIVGSWTGYHLAKSGGKTLILEQVGMFHSQTLKQYIFKSMLLDGV